MSATRSFSLSRNLRLTFFGLIILPLMGPAAIWSQLVPVQANIDAQAQQRLQADTEKAHRQRRIEENIQKITPALSAKNLTSQDGPTLTRRALAAIFDLRSEGISTEDGLRRAALPISAEVGTPPGPSRYLLHCWQEAAKHITPEIAAKFRDGLAPGFPIPPYEP
ncbi:MAG: hypothetical protein NTZ01_00465 [Verrucomicrobia bacterium]|nr:hypothetical protein [Verrucomicrobiota bacterium]